MSRTPTRREQILSAALEVLEDDGYDALTMRRLADEIDVRAPSLYKHFGSRDEILTALQARGFEEFGRGVNDGTSQRLVGVGAILAAYRAWALQHPNWYGLMTRHRLRRDDLPVGLEAAAAAPLLAAVGNNPDQARALWAAAHGLVDLQLADRFPPGADLDGAWAALVTAFE